MRCPVLPFTNTFVLIERSIVDIQSLQRHGNPTRSRTSSRKGQATVSNALARSILMSTVGHFLARSQRQASWTDLKFSCINRPRMKADWLAFTI